MVGLLTRLANGTATLSRLNRRPLGEQTKPRRLQHEPLSRPIMGCDPTCPCGTREAVQRIGRAPCSLEKRDLTRQPNREHTLRVSGVKQLLRLGSSKLDSSRILSAVPGSMNDDMSCVGMRRGGAVAASRFDEG